MRKCVLCHMRTTKAQISLFLWLHRPVCVWPGRKLPKTRFVVSWLRWWLYWQKPGASWLAIHLQQSLDSNKHGQVRVRLHPVPWVQPCFSSMPSHKHVMNAIKYKFKLFKNACHLLARIISVKSHLNLQNIELQFFKLRNSSCVCHV